MVRTKKNRQHRKKINLDIEKSTKKNALSDADFKVRSNNFVYILLKYI